VAERSAIKIIDFAVVNENTDRIFKRPFLWPKL
jgi:hypothetical protein